MQAAREKDFDLVFMVRASVHRVALVCNALSAWHLSKIVVRLRIYAGYGDASDEWGRCMFSDQQDQTENASSNCICHRARHGNVSKAGIRRGGIWVCFQAFQSGEDTVIDRVNTVGSCERKRFLALGCTKATHLFIRTFFYHRKLTFGFCILVSTLVLYIALLSHCHGHRTPSPLIL